MTAKQKHRDYQNNLPSVTTVLGIVPSPGLLEWFKRTPYYEILEKSNKGRTIGKQIHEVIEMSILGEDAKIETQYADEVMNALKSFQKFKNQHSEFILKHAEIQMTCPKYKYNGTVDCIARMKLSDKEKEKTGQEEELCLLDWKSGEAKDYNIPAIYPEAHWQTSAYVNLWNQNNEEKIKRAFILSVAKDKIAYNLEEVTEKEIKQSFKNYFLPLLKVYNYRKNNKGEQNDRQNKN